MSSQNKVFTQTGNEGRSYQFTILFTLLSAGRVEWRGLGGILMKGMFVEMDRARGWVLAHGKKKDNQCAYCQYSNLPAHLYRIISLPFSPFRVSSKK